MITIPLTVAITMGSILLILERYYIQCDKEKVAQNALVDAQDIEALRKEFTEYKKRVDTLTLKAGFKI